MLKKVIIVEKKELKRGKDKNGRDWVLTSVKTSGGTIASTFDDLPLDTEMELEVEETTYQKKDGSEGKGWNISRPKAPRGIDPKVIGEIKESIAALNQRMDFVEIGLNSLRREEIQAKEAKENPTPF